tara:strand:+ start:797 stop:1057 length:261 start_codon:yes stop_codon:yes gene_type:complete
VGRGELKEGGDEKGDHEYHSRNGGNGASIALLSVSSRAIVVHVNSVKIVIVNLVSDISGNRVSPPGAREITCEKVKHEKTIEDTFK